MGVGTLRRIGGANGAEIRHRLVRNKIRGVAEPQCRILVDRQIPGAESGTFFPGLQHTIGLQPKDTLEKKDR